MSNGKDRKYEEIKNLKNKLVESMKELNQFDSINYLSKKLKMEKEILNNDLIFIEENQIGYAFIESNFLKKNKENICVEFSYSNALDDGYFFDRLESFKYKLIGLSKVDGFNRTGIRVFEFKKL